MIDIKTIKESPFRYREEWAKWIDEFPLEKKSVEHIADIMKVISNDMASGIYIEDVVNSKIVESNPIKFLELLKGRSDSIAVLWLKGEIIRKFNLIDFSSLKNENPFVRLAYIMSSASKDYIQADKSLRELWKLKDDKLNPHLLMHMVRLSDKIDFSDIFSEVEGENLIYLIRILSARDKAIVKNLKELLKKAISVNINGADEVWKYTHFRDIPESEIKELFLETLNKYRLFEIRDFKWAFRGILEKSKNLASFLLSGSFTLSKVNELEIWSIIAKTKPLETVNNFQTLLKKDNETQTGYREIASILDEVKRSFFYSSSEQEARGLYKFLGAWLKGKKFLSFDILSDSKLNNLSKNEILDKVDKILERILSNIVDLDKKIVLAELRNYPFLSKIILTKVKDFLNKNEYNPILDSLIRANESSRLGHLYWKEFLGDIEYYSKNFPNVKNEKYLTKSSRKGKIRNAVLTELDTFMSEVVMFNRLHKASILITCEPKIGENHPEYLVNLNSKKTILEVKNFDAPQDLRLGGISNKMEHKSRGDFKEAFYQTVPLIGQKHPVVLLFDRSRSFVDDFIIHNILHGTYSVVIPIEKSVEPSEFRKQDYISLKKPLAKFIQGVVLFNHIFNNGKVKLTGNLIEHKYRTQILTQKDLDDLTKIILD